MKNNIDTIIRRTQRYWYVDGLAEITVGLFFVVMGGYFFIQTRIRALSLNPVLANFALLAALLFVLGIFRYALQTVKAHLTYPRTGYVAYPLMQKGLSWQRYGLVVWLIVVCISLAVLVIHSPGIPAWAPLLMGMVAGLTVLALSYRFRLMRFAFLACGLVLIGAVVSYFHPAWPLAAVLSSIADGACFIVSGGVTLVRYLRDTQSSAESDL